MRPPPKPNSCPTRADEILGTGNVAAPSITHSADARTRRYDRLRHPRRSGQELYSLHRVRPGQPQHEFRPNGPHAILQVHLRYQQVGHANRAPGPNQIQPPDPHHQQPARKRRP